MAIKAYHLGLPFWGFDGWSGTLYRRGSRSAESLEQYARVFNAVEGNTTFYSVPGVETVARWGESTPEDFRFAFKFPRHVTHELGLVGAQGPAQAFLERVAPLGSRAGPFMIQLPPAFGPSSLQNLETFLGALPAGPRYAVELRHRAFFERDAGRRVNALLRDARCERVVLDTRAMRSGDRSHPDLQQVAHRKPNLPVAPIVTHAAPIVRFIGHPEREANTPWLDTWARQFATWIGEGRAPTMFIHTPSNVNAPELARDFHRALSRQADVGTLPEWPGEQQPAQARQLRLL